VYEHCGLWQGGALFAHCIHLAPDHFAQLQRAEAAVVHCPESNLFLHSGRFPLELARASGVRIALGSDVGAGAHYSMFEAQRLAALSQPESVAVRYAFYLATLGGARALGWQHEIGNFQVVKAADFVVLDVRSLPAARSMIAGDGDVENGLSQLVHRVTEARVVTTFIAGRPAYAAPR
jgi:guanine deaminase